MQLNKLSQTLLPVVETELQQAIAKIDGLGLNELHNMLVYHMGWKGEGAGPQATGKRIRPLIVLLTAQAAGSNWENALPAAAAVELIHNFSLLHDDIEDNSQLRRGRPTVWTKWGIPQAINAGDAMFTLAHLALLRLEETVSPVITLRATRLLQQTCLHLTQGQYLDISYEKRDRLSLEDYWPMVTGKTAALIAACTELGALIADAGEDTCNDYRSFGLNLGLAFQVLDDVLGIWGDSDIIGKSNTSDLVEGKKSLPVLVGLQKKGKFANRWMEGLITPEEVPALAEQLELEGGRAYAQNQADRLTQLALQSLEDANPQGEAGEALFELADILLKRQV